MQRMKWTRTETESSQVAGELVRIALSEGKTTLRGKTATGAYFVRIYCTGNQAAIYAAAARREVREQAKAQAAKAAAIVELHQASIEQAKAKPATAKPARCAHWATIKAFFAIARANGLSTGKESDGPMRRAFSSYFGFTVWSRSDLTATHWDCAIAGIKAGELAW